MSIEAEIGNVNRDPRNNKIMSTGFLFCPTCGLRKPGDHASQYCPYCHTKMIQEGPLPCIPKSNQADRKKTEDKRIKIDIHNPESDRIQEEGPDKVKYSFNCIGTIEKADRGQYSEAINEFTEAIKVNPDNAEAYFARATIKVRMGDLKGARKDFIMCERCHCKQDQNQYPII